MHFHENIFKTKEKKESKEGKKKRKRKETYLPLERQAGPRVQSIDAAILPGIGSATTGKLHPPLPLLKRCRFIKFKIKIFPKSGKSHLHLQKTGVLTRRHRRP